MTTEYTKNFALAKPDFRMGPWHDLLNTNADKIDSVIYGGLSGASKPPWVHSTAYTIGVQVTDTDSASTWLCNVNHTSAATGTFAADRAAHPTYWVQILSGFAPRGEWQHSTQYYPYDLAYDSSRGIFAQCKTQHVSNVSGTIKDDAAYWYWIVDFSSAALSTATTVSYTPASGLTATNVQGAIDQVEGQIHALDSVNTAQGNQITTLQNQDASDNTRMTNIENKNTTQDTNITNLQATVTSLQNQINAINAAGAVLLAGNQTIGPGGYSATGKNLGNLASFTINPLNGNYQYGANVGAFTITAPTVDGGVDLLITNGATAAVPALTGFTVNVLNVGDPFTTTNGHRFLVSIRRIGGISTYTVKALQ